MTDKEFIEKMRELYPFLHDGEVSLDMLYEGFKIAVEEMERLNDIEDNTIQMQAHIDYLRERVEELEDREAER